MTKSGNNPAVIFLSYLWWMDDLLAPRHHTGNRGHVSKTLSGSAKDGQTIFATFFEFTSLPCLKEFREEGTAESVLHGNK